LLDFSANVRELYTSEDRAAGVILAHDRRGGERQFPLMRSSIAVLEIAECYVQADINRVSASIAAIKASTKESAAGLVISRLHES
jgi:hypothetical protein